MNRLRPAAAWSYLRAVLRTARPDGMIPHCTQVSGRQSDITQPPILAWGVWENFQHTRDRAALEWALPRLEKYLVWDVENRDTNGNGLLEWRGGRGDESGLDNSQRFDSQEWLDAVDFSVFAAHDMNCLSQIALALGQPERAMRWNYLSRLTARAVHEQLWHPRDGFYYDRHFDGRLSPVKAVTGFLPLLLDSLLYERVDRLLAMLRDPAHFASACPVPSVALSTPGYGTDMWRGATWLNTNWLVIEGLRRRRRPDAAAALAQATLDLVRRQYQSSGVIFEFYDSSGRLPPSRCDRKGPHRPDLPYDFRRKYDSIRDYHWSAAVTAMLLLDGRE